MSRGGNWCKKVHREDFKIHLIKATVNHKGKEYNTLPDLILAQKYYPSFKTRYCTRQFKIKPIDDFLEQYKGEGVELMIGLNADEIDLRTGNHGNKKFIHYFYPLADNKLTRAACILILNHAGLNPHFPAGIILSSISFIA